MLLKIKSGVTNSEQNANTCLKEAYEASPASLGPDHKQYNNTELPSRFPQFIAAFLQ